MGNSPRRTRNSKRSKDIKNTITRRRAVKGLMSSDIKFASSWTGKVHVMVPDEAFPAIASLAPLLDGKRWISICGLFRAYRAWFDPHRIVNWKYSRNKCKTCNKRFKEVW